MHLRKTAYVLLALACTWGTAQAQTENALMSKFPSLGAAADAFIADYTKTYLVLYAEAAEAEWAANTKIVPGDDTNDKRVNAANQALSQHTGAVAHIERAKALLKNKDKLQPLQIKQLEVILYNAAQNPQTVPELVRRRIEAETAQNKQLFGFEFRIDDKPVTPNDIDRILRESLDEKERLKAWTSSKEVGKTLKDGLANLVTLRNKTVQALGYENYFQYQVSDYGMTQAEMMEMCLRFVRELRPLYREIHTWARYELAKRYGADKVPDLIPAHWLPNRWGQSWSALVTVEGFDVDAALAEKDAEWIVKTSEAFYRSLGYDALPQVFWDKSSLYPLPADASYKKNTHASAWHMDLQNDVRSLMSVEPNSNWYETTHHELGHIYYYMAYSRPEVPPLLRGGANRAFHEGIGSLIGKASMQKPYLAQLNLVSEDAKVDKIQLLLKQALDFAVFIPWSCGTMAHFEHDLYTKNLKKGEYNQKWWAIVAQFQGIAPPEPRGEIYCDAATKTHINNDAAQYYDYGLSEIILQQLHAHIAGKILKQPATEANYYGNKEVGKFLWNILKVGASEDWRKLMRDNLGEEISAKAALEYFAPLMDYLKAQNKGRKVTLPTL